jgi:hypothetical protein
LQICGFGQFEEEPQNWVEEVEIKFNFMGSAVQMPEPSIGDSYETQNTLFLYQTLFPFIPQEYLSRFL